MAVSYPNGVAAPSPGDQIPSDGASAWQLVASTADAAVGTRATVAALDAIRPDLLTRGNLPTGTNIDDWYAGGRNGFWRASAANAGTITGLPPGTSGQAFNLLVLGSVTRVSTQIYFPYGFYSTTPMIRFVANISDNSWTPWAPLGGTPPTPDESDGTEGAWGAHEAQVARFIAAMGGPIDTGGKAAVAIRFDHGLANFKSKILPLTQARGFKVAQAYNPGNWHYPENTGVTASELNSWVAAGDVEIWNHSATHAPADTDATLYTQIVEGLAQIEAELPAAAGNVWGWNPPGVSSGTYGGYDGGKTPAGWNTYAGRLILAHHAVASGSLIGTQLHPLDGAPRAGLARYQMDSLTPATIKAKIDEAVAAGKGLQLMMHPSQIDLSGMLTTAGFTEVLDYLVTLQDAGDLVVLSPYQLTVADASGRVDVDAALAAYQAAIA